MRTTRNTVQFGSKRAERIIVVRTKTNVRIENAVCNAAIHHPAEQNGKERDGFCLWMRSESVSLAAYAEMECAMNVVRMNNWMHFSFGARENLIGSSITVVRSEATLELK